MGRVGGETLSHHPTTYQKDEQYRVTLLVGHATVEEGWLEEMVDRRTMYDDASTGGAP